MAEAETMSDFASNQQNRCFHRLSTRVPYSLLSAYVGGRQGMRAVGRPAAKSERRCVCFDCVTLGAVPLSRPTLIPMGVIEQTTDPINWNPRGFM